jgi:molybdate transport system substrate-binding protein
MRRIVRFASWIAIVFCGATALPGHAEEIAVAAAANLRTVLAEGLAPAFESKTGHHLKISFGSTGGFYAQIKNGAAFDIVLAADDATPEKLELDGLTAPGTRFTYATGTLVLWSSQPGFVDKNGDVLRSDKYKHIALANPKLAPYGAAAVETLRALNLFDGLQEKIVRGEDINQTYQFIATGNAPLGFVALSQVMRKGAVASGSYWLVPAKLYTPIHQDAVILAKAHAKVGAAIFARFLQGEEARAIMRSYGYTF